MKRSATVMAAPRRAPLAGCMYCGAAGVPRTEEHLVPQSLGGRATLRDAVCEPCRVLTGEPERATLAREFAVPRTLLALKRRRARRPGPRVLAPVVLDDSEHAIVIDDGSYPRSFWLPRFAPPGRLVRADSADAVPLAGFSRCHLALGTVRHATVAAPPALPDPVAYARTVAKWAFGLALAHDGLAGCDTRALRDLLLGRRNDVFAFVGGAPSDATPSADVLHAVAVRDEAGWRVARLALLASAGMTPYDVVLAPMPAAG